MDISETLKDLTLAKEKCRLWGVEEGGGRGVGGGGKENMKKKSRILLRCEMSMAFVKQQVLEIELLQNKYILLIVFMKSEMK